MAALRKSWQTQHKQQSKGSSHGRILGDPDCLKKLPVLGIERSVHTFPRWSGNPPAIVAAQRLDWWITPDVTPRNPRYPPSSPYRVSTSANCPDVSPQTASGHRDRTQLQSRQQIAPLPVRPHMTWKCLWHSDSHRRTRK